MLLAARLSSFVSVLTLVVVLVGCGTPGPVVTPTLPAEVITELTPTPTILSTEIPEAREAKSRFAYVDPEGGLWVINVDGSGKRRVGDQCADAGELGELSWSPTGDALLCRLAEFPSPASVVRVVDLMGNVLAEVNDGRGTRDSSWSPVALWSPDGRRIAYHSQEVALKIVNLADETTNIINTNAIPLAWPFTGRMVVGLNVRTEGVWSPNDSHIAYRREGRTFKLASLGAGRWEGPLSLYNYETYWLDLSTGETEPIPRLDAPRQFWLSLDGTKTVLLAEEYIPERSGFPLMVYDLTTGEEWEIPDSAIGYPAEYIPYDRLAISVDSKIVYWVTSNGNIYRADLDGSGTALLGTVPSDDVAMSQEGIVAYALRDADQNVTIVLRDFATDTSIELEIGRWTGQVLMAWFTPPL